MRLGVLGPLAVWDDEGEPVRVAETKVRALLADLLAHEGGPVSADRLIHDLWGDHLPGNPAGALQAKVSQLRRVLGRERLVRQPPGYRLRLDPADDVDVGRFGRLVAQARSVTDPRARAALLTEALGLWRGPAYADFADEEFARAARECLAEQRLAVLEERAEARLAAGDHLLLAGELAALVAEHPLRERLRAVQMQALYRAGHQGEALASYEDLRTRLADELGACPGPAVSALHQAMLRQDPTLDPNAPIPPGPAAAPTGPVVAPAPTGRNVTSAAADRADAPASAGRAEPPPGAASHPGPSHAGAPCSASAQAGAQSAELPHAGLPSAGRPEAGAPYAVSPQAGSQPGELPDAGPSPAGSPCPASPQAGLPSAGPSPAGRPEAGLSHAGAPYPASSQAGSQPGELSDAGPSPAGSPCPASPQAGLPSAGSPHAGPSPAGSLEAGSQPAVSAYAGPSSGGPPHAGPTSGSPYSEPLGAGSPYPASPQAQAASPYPASAPAPPVLAASAPPASTPAPTNLPVPLTALIGREESLAHLSRLLGRQRLVTLTGPGGVGKTRLAVAAAQEVAGGDALLPDGAWFVEFAGVRSATPDDLADLVAATLGIRDDAPCTPPATGTCATSPVHRLTAALRDRRTLLVLDNCEHVVAAAAELVALLLRSAPQLRILTTSQEPLALAGEAVFLVEPLPTPDAVRLFTERAAACAPGFRLGSGEPDGSGEGAAADHTAVAGICRRLDGIPLALELAATKVRALGVRELAARLGDRFRVLTSGQRGAPARQQTLRAMIDWSWELLSPPERLVLSRLAVHRDGCGLDAAEAVCAGEGVARGAVLDLVTRLVEKSLVVVTDGPAGPRYRLLESVAAYATERLRETADEAAARERHLRHYLALAEHAEPRLRGPRQRDWLTRLDTEACNLRAALDEAVRRAAAGHSEEAVRLATALSWWWLLRGRLTEARRSLAAVLTATAGRCDPELALLHCAFGLLTGERTVTCHADAVPDPVRRARALWLNAYGRFSVGDLDGSRALNTRALIHFEAADEQWGIAAALGLRAALALVRGDLDGLARDGQRSRALFRGLGDRWGELQTVSPLAALAEIKGEYEQAAHRQHEGLQIARELSLEAEVSARLSGLGRLALLARDFDRARELHEQARRIAVDQGYKYGEIHADMGLALGARRSGDIDAAEAHLLRIREAHAAVSSPAGDHLLHAELGFIAELRGDAARSAAHHLRSLGIAHSLDESRALALSLEGLAGTAALGGDRPGAACAALLLGAAHAARHRVGAPLPPAERGDVDRVTAAARAVLGPRAFTEAFERGTRLSPAEAEHHARTTLAGLADQAA
ncbi:BTAD domain-containing putative transcriptional regulator [Streptomyces cyanogenus]|uniref:HTH-type transcriptional regulator n=1 Tax=Streptomyces cyanogenus TaxID=80860 RepID=A0ABX7U294_STRCY|nr:BTAD domain-containing putative transcriptional regulator [Streptomyces cyanogenus]QTE01884.1 Putative HTH-type transcriptional regulator [Streptomyces cyanogenus]